MSESVETSDLFRDNVMFEDGCLSGLCVLAIASGLRVAALVDGHNRS